MSDLRARTAEITAEYWSARDTNSERGCVAQLALALARAEADRDSWQKVAREYEAALSDRGLL